MKYFILNDTDIECHHGCSTVMQNLKLGMQRHDFICVGSLSVGSNVTGLLAMSEQLDKADIIVINGEGTLHHDAFNAKKILELLLFLKDIKPIFLINSTWEENKDSRWKLALSYCTAIYVRDLASLNNIKKLYPNVKYAPDLTFYHVPSIKNDIRTNKFLCTDSVFYTWSKKAEVFCKSTNQMDYVSIFDGRLTRLIKQGSIPRKVINAFLGGIYKVLGIALKFEYINFNYTINDTLEFRKYIQSYSAVYTARYHCLCFCIQQNIPFLIKSSNTLKSESLLSDIGVNPQSYINENEINENIISTLSDAIDLFYADKEKFESFCKTAKELCAEMFQNIASSSYEAFNNKENV